MRAHKGVYYFPTYADAEAYAATVGVKHGDDQVYAPGRINLFGLGWAIQLRCSGPYVGPAVPPLTHKQVDARRRTR